MLQNKKILIGVTGSIAAYKACDLVQRLKEQGAEVRVVMTASATKLVHPNTFAALTGAPASEDVWTDASNGTMRHIELARWADVFIVAPCTAHTLAELSLGLTGSLISLTALAYQGLLMVAPAMNTVMLESAPVQEHLQRLSARGMIVLPTASGDLACGETGEGKLITPEEIVQYIDLALSFGKTVPNLGGTKVLISGGHTEEPLDGVRFLSNRSSGKTALAIARAFKVAGAEVNLVLGKATEPDPSGIKTCRVHTSAEFHGAMIPAQKNSNVVVMAAAIADFIPARTDAGKWKDSRAIKSLELQPSPNILQELGHNKSKGQVLVGFALETDSPIPNAREKLKARNCDFVVVNTPLSQTGLGFGEERVEAAILGQENISGDPKLEVVSKNQLAADLVRRIAVQLKAKA